MNSRCCVTLGVTFFLDQLWSLGNEQTPVAGASVTAPHYVNINGFLMNGNKTPERYICFPIACCAGRRWWMFHVGDIKGWMNDATILSARHLTFFSAPLTCWGPPCRWPCWRRRGRVARPGLGSLGELLEREQHLSYLDRGSETQRSALQLTVWAGAWHGATRQSAWAEGQLEPRHNSSLSSPVPRKEGGEREIDANRWVSWQERWVGMRHKWYASAPLGFLHNWAYHGLTHAHKRKHTGTLTGMHKSCEQSSCEAERGNKWAITEADVKS